MGPADVPPVVVVNGTGVDGLANQEAQALRVQGFAKVTTSSTTERRDGVLVEFSSGQEEAARTVAAAFPGARTKKAAGLGGAIRVTIGPGAENVVEVPNRVGTAPVPRPSVTAPAPTASFQARTADQDICS